MLPDGEEVSTCEANAYDLVSWTSDAQEDRLAVCRELLARASMPSSCLPPNTVEMVRGWTHRADDYLVKPFAGELAESELCCGEAAPGRRARGVTWCSIPDRGALRGDKWWS
jgi:hypothetical protein